MASPGYDCKVPIRSKYNLTDYASEVLHTPIKRGASELPLMHNAIRLLAIERKLDFYLYQHTDVVIAPLVSDARSTILSAVEGAPAKWAFLFFNYDRLAAYRISGLQNVIMWDENTPAYGEDCDFYGRLGMAGFGLHNAKVPPGVFESLHIKTHAYYENIPQHVDGAHAWAKAHESDKEGGTEGFTFGMNEQEKSMYFSQEAAGKEYYLRKWGHVKDFCNIFAEYQAQKACKVKHTEKAWKTCLGTSNCQAMRLNAEQSPSSSEVVFSQDVLERTLSRIVS